MSNIPKPDTSTRDDSSLCDDCHMECNERTGLELINLDGHQFCEDCYQDAIDAACEYCYLLSCRCDSQEEYS